MSKVTVGIIEDSIFNGKRNMLLRVKIYGPSVVSKSDDSKRIDKLTEYMRKQFGDKMEYER